MEYKLTKQQKEAMELSDRLTVVSAAAGSGKTTILVKRALRILSDESNPVPADRLLIVTFSNASAADFKKKIEEGINEIIKENPKNNYIKSQKAALQKADISTIHSFCIKLVRENFQDLDISPDFTICDNAQSDDLHRKAIDKAMEYGYGLADFKQLVSFYGKSSNDRRIREFLRQMDYFFSALPHPEKQAQTMAEEYSAKPMSQTAAYNQLKNSLGLLSDYLVYLSNRMDYLYQNSDFEGYENGIRSVQRQALSISDAVKKGNFQQLALLLNESSISLGKAKPACEASNAINKSVYGAYKKTAENMAKTLEYLDRDAYSKQISDTEKYVRVLVSVYLKYQNILLRLKKDRKTFEFSDFEHFALKLLQNEDGSPTRLALSLREKYEYIMEDEFQDTSYVQDAIFTMVAREGQKNLYVVGDVKQSIYGFRKASPQIFLSKRQIGIDDKSKGRTIYLPHNFRSEHSVIGGVNYIFRKLMSSMCGGVEYDENEELKTKKDADGSVGIKLNIYSENEAENTARRISRMIKEGYTINAAEGSRPVKSGDFCILMRNKKHFGEYKAALEKLGYEAFVRDDELILQKNEVQSIINLLKVVANPLQEVYLTATMFGDLFGFTLDEILKIRVDNPKVNLYKALALSQSPKAAYLLGVLKDLSYVSGVYSADKLIDYICRTTGYYRRLSLSEDGTEKRENIRWFIGFAKNWAKTHPSNPAAFLRRIEMYMQSGGMPDQEGEKSDKAISIMTMHTSKGLEFPVVFVTGLATKFNKTDTAKRLLLDTEIGIGMYTNTKFGYNRSTMNIHAIKNKTERTSADEEMRLLYVAFTRSKNLLVMSAEYNKTFTASSISKTVALTGDKPHPAQLLEASCPIQWVLSALKGHPAVCDLFSFGKEDKNIPQTIEISFDDPAESEAGISLEEMRIDVSADIEKIKENLKFEYPHKAKTLLPIKLSVSDIAKSSALVLAKPDFIKDRKTTAAEKGTAMHLFAQHVNILLARSDFQTELQNLERKVPLDISLLDIPAIEKFIYSDVANKILNSEKVYTEKDFLVPYNAADALGDETYREDEVMIQGVMDCVLQNGDEITVIDYKTDFITDMDSLYKRYSKQLELYRHGAKMLFQTGKVKCILYSFHLNEYLEF